MTAPTPSSTLKESKEWLRENWEVGVDCPCCGQRVQLYPFGANGAMARGLLAMYRRGRRDWVNVPELKLPGGHMLKFRFWGLIEKPPELLRDDGSARVGIWRITAAGERWLRGETTIPRKAHLYNNGCYGFSGEPITFEQCLGERFDFHELMSGA